MEGGRGGGGGVKIEGLDCLAGLRYVLYVVIKAACVYSSFPFFTISSSFFRFLISLLAMGALEGYFLQYKYAGIIMDHAHADRFNPSVKPMAPETSRPSGGWMVFS